MKSFQQGSVVQPVSKQLVNGGPAAVSTQMTTLGTNLLELDTLLDELDAVELSDDVLQHSGVGEVISLNLNCNCNCNRGTCIAPPTRSLRVHHRVSPYPGARRQNETKC